MKKLSILAVLIVFSFSLFSQINLSLKENTSKLNAFYFNEYLDFELGNVSVEMTEKSRNYRKLFDLPEQFPAIEITVSNKPTGGYYFMNRMTQSPDVFRYLIIMDTLGFPVYYNEMDSEQQISNFDMQQTGQLTYWDQADTVYYEMDSSYNVINSYGAENGYDADGHEIIVLDDGSYWLMIYDTQIVDMSQIVTGGQENAYVTGIVIQHIDAAGNVLFEWSGWDHFEITDADPAIVNLTNSGIDYVHGNALDFDFDGNLLLSSRNLSEITKINISTGDIIWRWGGTQNQFDFIGDSVMFSAQHDIRYLGNNKYSLFDNGWGNIVKFSRGVCYELDTIAMTATLISDYNYSDSLLFSPFMGGNYRGDDNESVVGWSINQKRHVLTEYDSLGNISLEMMSIDTGGLVSYRAGKHLWETNAVSFDQDKYFIEEAEVGETVILEFEFQNNTTEIFDLNGFNSSDSTFSLQEPIPISISPSETLTLHLLFSPSEEKAYTSAVSLFTDNQQKRIAKQFRVNTAVVTSLNEITELKPEFKLSPNPAHNSVLITTGDNSNIYNIEVFSILGENVISKTVNRTNQYLLNIQGQKPGVYILRLETSSGIVSKRLLIN